MGFLLESALNAVMRGVAMKKSIFLPTIIAAFLPLAASAYNLMPDQNFTQTVGTSVADISGVTVTPNGTSTPAVVAGNLTYPNLSLGSGNSVNLAAGASSFTISFTPPNFEENPSEYNNTCFSLLVKIGISGSLSGGGTNIVSLVRDGVDIAGFAVRDNGSGGINVGATRAGTSTQWNPSVIDYDATFLLYGRYSWEAPFSRPGGLHGFAYSLEYAEAFASSNGPDGPFDAEFWTFSYTDSLQPNGIKINSSATTDITVDAARVGTVGGNVTPSAVPEPSTWFLLIMAAAGIFGIRKFRKARLP